MMQRLHNQVLCPAVGWCSGYHGYAFRRVHELCVPKHSGNTVDRDEDTSYAMKLLQEEVWIGPKVCTSLFASLFAK